MIRRTSSRERKTDLAKRALPHATEEDEMEEIDLSVKIYGLEEGNELLQAARRQARDGRTWGRQQTAPMMRRQQGETGWREEGR